MGLKFGLRSGLGSGLRSGPNSGLRSGPGLGIRSGLRSGLTVKMDRRFLLNREGVTVQKRHGPGPEGGGTSGGFDANRLSFFKLSSFFCFFFSKLRCSD